MSCFLPATRLFTAKLVIWGYDDAAGTVRLVLTPHQARQCHCASIRISPHYFVLPTYRVITFLHVIWVLSYLLYVYLGTIILVCIHGGNVKSILQ